jgi:hypothetical protein
MFLRLIYIFVSIKLIKMDTTEEQAQAPIERGTSLFQRGAAADPTLNGLPKKETPQPKAEEPIVEDQPTKPISTKETEVEKEVEDPKPEAPKASDDREEEEGGYQPLDLSFGKEEPKKEAKTEEAPKGTENAITDEAVLGYLKTKGIDVDDISNLARKETLSENVQKFKDFEEQTGRGMTDFLNSQKDWSKESKDSTLREFLKYEYPSYSEEDLEEHMNMITLTEDDEDEMSAKEISKKKLESKQLYNKALDFMQKKSKEFATPTKTNAQPQSEEQVAESYKPYWNKRDKSLQSFNEITMSLGGKEISLPISEEQKSMLATATQSIDSLFQPYVQEAQKGEVGVNTDSLIEDQAWANKSIRASLLADFSKKLQSIVIDTFSKENRNVTLGKNSKGNPKQESKAGLTVVSKSKNSNRIGKALI